MRIYVSIDMQGLAGVAHPQQVAYGRGVDRVDHRTFVALTRLAANPVAG